MNAAPAGAAWRVPGRIEILGKHTDYAGGRVLVGAVDRAVIARAARLEEAHAEPGTLLAVDEGHFSESVRLTAGRSSGLPAGHWGNYLQTVLDRLTSNFGPTVPARLTISSDLPPASGMSSSSAIVCASALALADLNDWSASSLWRESIPDRLATAGYLAAIESGRPWRALAGTTGVGTQGGSEDHTGMVCGSTDALLLAHFDPMEILGRVAFPTDWSIVIGVCGILAEKTGEALTDYNRGPLALREVLARWNESTGRSDAFLAGAVRSLIGEATGEAALADPALERLRALTEPGYERERVEQFLLESLVLVPEGATAIARADTAAAGEILARSHDAADHWLGNQVPQTNALVGLANKLGAIGASGFGAGWGGSVYAIVPRVDAEGFAAEWLAHYRRRVDAPERAGVLVTRPGPGAHRL